MRRNNFTLIEMVAVIAVTSILVVMTIQVFKTDPTQAAVAQVGGACTFSKATSFNQDKPVTVELKSNKFEASYIDNAGVKVVFKMFNLVKGVDSKIVRGGDEIESYTIYKGEIDGGLAVTIKIRKYGEAQASIIWINAFTGRVSYYDKNGSKVVAW